jgi:hypothetical protein
MNEIKKRKLALQPLVQSRIKYKSDYYKAEHARRMKELKCFWTYPWGHISNEDGRDGRSFSRCLVCDKYVV